MEHAGRRAACGGVVGVRAVRWWGSGQRAGGADQGPTGAPCLDPITSTLFEAGRRGQESPASHHGRTGEGPIIPFTGAVTVTAYNGPVGMTERRALAPLPTPP